MMTLETEIEFDSTEQVVTLDSLGVEGFAFDSREGAREALEVLDEAQKTVNGYRANLGALQNRLISTSENLGTAVENFTAGKLSNQRYGCGRSLS